MDPDIRQTWDLLDKAQIVISKTAIARWTPSQRMDARTWALLEIDAQRRGDPGHVWPEFLREALR